MHPIKYLEIKPSINLKIEKISNNMKTVKKENDFLSQKIYDKSANYFVKKLAKTKITPNQMTLFGLILDIFTAQLFFIGTYFTLILGGVLIQLSFFMDRMDGQLARMKGIASKYGQLLDEGLGVFGMSLIFIGAIGGYYNKTGSIYIWYLGFFALLGLLMMNLFAHLSKEIYGKNNNAGKKLREKINKKTGNKFHPRLFAFSADIQRGIMSLAGFVNFAPLFLWAFAIMGNLYWIARYFVYRSFK